MKNRATDFWVEFIKGEFCIKIASSSIIYLIFINRGKGKGREKIVDFNITRKARKAIPTATMTAKTRWRDQRGRGRVPGYI